MLPRNSPAPAASVLISERLGLANSLEWIGENCRHQIDNSQRDFAIRFNPPPQVFSKVRRNYSDSGVLGGHWRLNASRPSQRNGVAVPRSSSFLGRGPVREETRAIALRLPVSASSELSLPIQQAHRRQ